MSDREDYRLTALVVLNPDQVLGVRAILEEAGANEEQLRLFDHTMKAHETKHVWG